jgi:hypothetical protein
MTCQEQVSYDSWNFHQCGKPAKFIIRNGGDRSRAVGRGEDLPVCGIHVPWFRRHATELQIDAVVPQGEPQA